MQLADFGSASHVTSEWAEQGAPIGAKIWTSPEAIMETPWNTATDIWSFGTVVRFAVEPIGSQTELNR